MHIVCVPLSAALEGPISNGISSASAANLEQSFQWYNIPIGINQFPDLWLPRIPLLGVVYPQVCYTWIVRIIQTCV